ncbi:MAG: hypothetical protein ACKO1F_09730 [Flammeovirgaceae bacterium]
MKNIIFVAVFVSIIYCQSKQKLVWSDEFDTEGAPDTTKWNYDLEMAVPKCAVGETMKHNSILINQKILG